MNFVAIDPSLISTALIVGNNLDFKTFNYCRESKVFGKKGITKWFHLAEQYVNYRFVEYREFKDYSEGELIKLKDYDKVTDDIINDILNSIDKSEPTKIGIEGFNFGASVGDLLDLVAFSTLLRKKLFDQVSEDITVLSPSTLKLEACKLTYQPEIKEVKGKTKRIEYIYKNNIGIPGGKFTKRDIFSSIVENENLNDYWSSHCKSIKEEILSMSSVPKPYEDLCDSFIIYQYLIK